MVGAVDDVVSWGGDGDSWLRDDCGGWGSSDDVGSWRSGDDG